MTHVWKMADQSRRILFDLLKNPGNEVCADCGCEEPGWASYNIGVFLCSTCAGIHRGLGVHISKIKSITLDKWDDSQLELMQAIGNEKARLTYEQFIPPYYRRPSPNDPQILKEQWIHAKYSRGEFQDPDRQSAYSSGNKEGYLLKRGRDDKKCHSRRFSLSSKNNSLVYYNKENAKAPKASINLDSLNAVFVPHKMSNPYTLQIAYESNGTTRQLFVYAEAKEIVDWYLAIRAAKLERRRIAFPDKNDAELTEDLTRDFTIEGWLYKKGPKEEPYKHRWFTLDKRKLMYSDDPLSAFPLGEVFVGHRENGYSVHEGTPNNTQSSTGYAFTLNTPQRKFQLCADKYDDMSRWIAALNNVMDIQLTAQEHKLWADLSVRQHSKKGNSGVF